MLAPSQQNKQKKSNKSRKPEKQKKSLVDPGRHFPVGVVERVVITANQ
jgi:hypothetical protein